MRLPNPSLWETICKIPNKLYYAIRYPQDVPDTVGVVLERRRIKEWEITRVAVKDLTLGHNVQIDDYLKSRLDMLMEHGTLIGETFLQTPKVSKNMKVLDGNGRVLAWRLYDEDAYIMVWKEVE